MPQMGWGFYEEAVPFPPLSKPANQPNENPRRGVKFTNIFFTKYFMPCYFGGESSVHACGNAAGCSCASGYRECRDRRATSPHCSTTHWRNPGRYVHTVGTCVKNFVPRTPWPNPGRYCHTVGTCVDVGEELRPPYNSLHLAVERRSSCSREPCPCRRRRRALSKKQAARVVCAVLAAQSHGRLCRGGTGFSTAAGGGKTEQRRAPGQAKRTSKQTNEQRKTNKQTSKKSAAFLKLCPGFKGLS
jgi:hypothetical protein